MMKYTEVSRKNAGEDRIATCPNFGCSYMKRVKPLKFRLFGFGRYPKCKNHNIPLVYVNEWIGEFVDGALACLFDMDALPPEELLKSVHIKYPDEFRSFIEDWIYCITIGRGARIVSRYMDTISNAYLKQLTKKQIKMIKKDGYSKLNLVNTAIKDGMDEISIQYTRILKQLRAHSEVFNDFEKFKPLSKELHTHLKNWQKNKLNNNEIMNSPEKKHKMTLVEMKQSYDDILNVNICQCLIGQKPDFNNAKNAEISAFDRFSAYYEFLKAGISSKFTKSIIENLYAKFSDRSIVESKNVFSVNREMMYEDLKKIIEKKGGKLLSIEYINAHTHVKVQCPKGHKWDITPTNVKSGYWCPVCKKETLSKKLTKYTIKDLKKFARNKGGDCLEDTYKGWGRNHHWKCGCEHKWTATPRNVIYHGTWCPICSESEIAERVARGIFEKLFNRPFPKSSPYWLNPSKKRGGQMHLDGYNKILHIAFEHQGIQHYRYDPFFHNNDIKNFYSQKERDLIKAQLCLKNKVTLIQFGCVKDGTEWRELNFDEIERIIRNELRKKGIEPSYPSKVDWTQYISIHRTEDLILKLMINNDKLTISEIASNLKLNLKGTSRHVKALKALGFITLTLGKQNKKYFSINQRYYNSIKERISNISMQIIKDRKEKIRPIAKEILDLLKEKCKLSTLEIAEELGYSKRTIEKYIKALEVSDLVEFQRATDRGNAHPKLWSSKE
ncbi:MAG: winged helix-turn-helix transcriptional regulator [Promethearchaeota archaeon]|nr:MAG: winged helix-turn-helix transcriptional regulator [Candidatus Lokiarchaeota archaeon]